MRERRDQLSTGSIFGYIEDVGDHNATSRCGFYISTISLVIVFCFSRPVDPESEWPFASQNLITLSPGRGGAVAKVSVNGLDLLEPQLETGIQVYQTLKVQ